MNLLEEKDFVSLDKNTLQLFTERSQQFYLIERDGNRCLLYLLPYYHYAYIIFNEGIDVQIIFDDLRSKSYLLALADNKCSDAFKPLKNIVLPLSAPSINKKFKYYAYV